MYCQCFRTPGFYEYIMLHTNRDDSSHGPLVLTLNRGMGSAETHVEFISDNSFRKREYGRPNQLYLPSWCYFIYLSVNTDFAEPDW